MEHDEIRSLIHPYVDGELNAANIRLVEDHLTGCPDCRAVEQGIRRLHTALTNSTPAFRAPASLRKKIRADLRRETAAKSERQAAWSWLSFDLGTACALLLLGFVFAQTYSGTSRNAITD